MASLNTLRTKFGVVLSVVIGLALLAFVLSLKTEMGFSGNDPKVGEINGKKIKYSEYIAEYEQLKAQNNASEGDPAQADMLADATWQTLLQKRVLDPGFDRMGIQVGEEERLGMITGEYPSQILSSAFADPRTGVYQVSAVTEFLAQAETNPQARAAWDNLNAQMLQQREIEKYIALVKGGTYVNKLEVELGVKGADNKYTGRWVRQRYDMIPDSTIQISQSEIKSYYNNHKKMFQQAPNRALTYVVFDVAATDADMAALEATVKGVGEEFMAAEEVKSFVRGNRNGEIAERYVPASQLPEDEAAALLAGRTYGPVLKNNAWTMARVVDEKVTPDTLGIRHIVLPMAQEKLADSLLTVLRAGGDFAAAAQQYSAYAATAANGGEVGKMPFSAFTNEFVTALSGAKQNDIVKVASGDMIQLMQVYYAGNPVRQMQIATINYPVEASNDTRRVIHNAAGTFQLNAKGDVQRFNDAAQTAAVSPRSATISQGERDLRGLEDSRDLVRWAYGAKEGEVSEIFTVGGNYVIAMLTGIDDGKYVSLENATETIRGNLLRDKKYELIASKVKGDTFDQMSTSFGQTEGGVFENLNYAMYYLPEVGVEPRLVGAISSSDKINEKHGPVKGMAGVYVFTVDSIATEPAQTAEAERVRVQSRMEGFAEQRSLQAIQQMADVQDLRGKFF